VHSLYVAFYTCRILTHSNTFSAWCILNVLHSTCDASECIIMYSSALRRKNTRFRWAPGRDLTRFMMLKNAHECTWMQKNASECTVIHQGPHTYLHKRKAERTQVGLKAKLTWTGCGRAILRRAIRAPMCHYMSSKSSSNAYTSEHTRVNASAYTSECVCEWMHLNALECVRMRVRQNATWNATCRQNTPYVGRHTNAFECNSCRMQRTANAQ
jgi:hypothetical protein